MPEEALSEENNEEENGEELNQEEQFTDADFARLSEDSQALEELLTDPNIRYALLASEQGIDLTQVLGEGEEQPAEQRIDINDPNANPADIVRQIVSDVLEEKLEARLGNIDQRVTNAISPLLQDRQMQMLWTEYTAVTAKDKSLDKGFDRVIQTMSKHPTLSMTEAIQLTPSLRNNIRSVSGKPAPRVGISSGRSGGAGSQGQEVSRLRKLQEDARKSTSASFRDKIVNAFRSR